MHSIGPTNLSHPCAVTGQSAEKPTRGLVKSCIGQSRTSKFADKPNYRLINLQTTSQLADSPKWSTHKRDLLSFLNLHDSVAVMQLVSMCMTSGWKSLHVLPTGICY